MPNNKKSKAISLRLFLDGVETRIIGATVNQRPNKPDTASIRLPAHPAIEGIKEKTLVHIFYNDEKQSHKDPDIEYKLLFEGQVAGAQTRLNQSGQSKVIQAESMAGYLTQTKASQTFLSGAYGKNVSQLDIRQKIKGKDDINISNKSVSNGKLRTQMKQAILGSENLQSACRQMLRIIFEHNSYLRDIVRRMRILDRFPLVEEDAQLKVDDFLKQDSATKLIQNATSNIKSEYPVLGLINNVLNIFFYRINLNSSILNTFGPVPKLINSPPPACNILTPDDFSNLTFSERHRAKPTRTALTLNHLGINTAYIWPPELAQPMNMFGEDSVDDIENFGELFTNEELLKGPRPQVQPVKKKVTKGNEENETLQAYYMNKARHNFNVSRRNANNLSLSGRFNPEVFPGFTSFVVAPSVDVIFGRLTSVTHSIDNQNNTATTSYEIGMPYKLLTNPDNLAPPETNPALTMSEDGEHPIPTNTLNNIYNLTMNSSFNNNAVNTWGEQRTLSVTQDHIDKYFNGRFNKEKYKKNPVLKRAVTAMGQYIDEKSFIGKSPDKNTAVGGENFRRRAHPNVEMVFEDFYKSNRINKGTGTNGDIWDLYNSENLDYISDELKEIKDKMEKRITFIQEGDLKPAKDNIKKLDDGGTLPTEDPDAEEPDVRQELKRQIRSARNRIKRLREQIDEVDEQIETIDDDKEKPVTLKTEYSSDDYDLQGILQKRQKIILNYNRVLTRSKGSIVGNMDIFENEILEDDDEEQDNGQQS